MIFLVPDRLPNPPRIRLFRFHPEETNMLNTAIADYVAPSLPSRIDIELRIRLKR